MLIDLIYVYLWEIMHDLHEDLINEDLYNKKIFCHGVRWVPWYSTITIGMVIDVYHGTLRSPLAWWSMCTMALSQWSLFKIISNEFKFANRSVQFAKKVGRNRPHVDPLQKVIVHGRWTWRYIHDKSRSIPWIISFQWQISFPCKSNIHPIQFLPNRSSFCIHRCIFLFINDKSCGMIVEDHMYFIAFHYWLYTSKFTVIYYCHRTEHS